MTLCPNCNHDSPHTGGAIGVCLTPTCGCDDAQPHDPLCQYRPDIATDYGVWERGQECRCGFIARVRKDTLNRVRQKIEKVPYVKPEYRNNFTNIAGAELDSVRKDFLTAVDSIKFTTPSKHEIGCPIPESTCECADIRKRQEAAAELIRLTQEMDLYP